ncbi:MAG: radical SAM protein [Deltaproteobacteria bacterium]|nr:radical SAM protein [Deltaproteobacteria bacterium]
MLQLLEKVGFVPRQGVWEITLACNLRCGHCGSRAGEARPDELTTEEAFGVIDNLATLGCRHMTLAGGEPTLREDWPQLVGRLREKGVLPSLLSNGLTWTRELCEHAKAAGIHHIGFSLDGLERTHDCVRKANDSYKKVLEAIDISVKAEVPVVAVTHITRRNIAQVEELHQLLHEHGVFIWQVQLGVPMGNMREDMEAVLPPEGVLELVPKIAEINQRGVSPRIVAADNIGYYGEHEEHLRRAGRRIPFWLGCRAGIDVIGIESNGDVKGCLSLPSGLNDCSDFIEGNVRRQSLVDIWCNPEAFAYNRKFSTDQLKGSCAGCDYGEICRGGCTWTAVSNTGHPHDFPQCYHCHTKGKAKPASA